MNWQLLIVLMLIAAAALYLGRVSWRMWRGRGQCAGGCDCGAKATAPRAETFIPSTSLQVKGRQ
jgi:hypothetical protein